MPAMAEMRRPYAYTIDGKYNYIAVPIFNTDKEIDYIIEFTLNLKKGPSRQVKVVYQSPYLGEPPPVIMKQAWKQAYAVWKEMKRRKII